jgi:predicted protein tyrosine phosphatase
MARSLPRPAVDATCVPTFARRAVPCVGDWKSPPRLSKPAYAGSRKADDVLVLSQAKNRLRVLVATNLFGNTRRLEIASTTIRNLPAQVSCQADAVLVLSQAKNRLRVLVATNLFGSTRRLEIASTTIETCLRRFAQSRRSACSEPSEESASGSCRDEFIRQHTAIGNRLHNYPKPTCAGFVQSRRRACSEPSEESASGSRRDEFIRQHRRTRILSLKFINSVAGNESNVHSGTTLAINIKLITTVIRRRSHKEE